MTDDPGFEPTDASPEPPAPDQASAEPEVDATPERTGPSRVMVVVAAVLLVVATFLGVLAARFKAELDRERDDRETARALAGRFAANFVTYDYRNLDASLERIQRDAVPSFARDFESQFRAQVVPGITETQARSVGDVEDVYLSSVEDEATSAFVLVNVSRTGAGGTLPLAGSYFRLDLVKRNGDWKVENVLSINFAGIAASPGAGGGGGPAPTTSSSVPK